MAGLAFTPVGLVFDYTVVDYDEIFLGYRPVIERDALTTAAGRQAARASPLIRSMSSWSMTAMSPGCRRLVSVFVRASTRTTPRSAAGSPPARNRRSPGPTSAGPDHAVL